jgi:signal peptidase I
MLARRAGRVVCTLLTAAGVLFGAMLVLPAALGWQRYAITSSSMTGTYDRGSLVFDEVVPASELVVGDVITYQPPADALHRGLITHRIQAIGTDHRGHRVFRTQGDANPTVDPWRFSLADTRQARVRLGVPYVGFLVALLYERSVRMLLLGLPAALIAVSSLLGLWREAGLEAAGVHA